MSRYVLDAYAIMTFLQREKGSERVRDIVRDAGEGKVELHVSLINLIEVGYMVARQTKRSEQLMAAVRDLPLTIASADEYAEQVTRLKTSYAISLGDCFCAALAIELGCPVLTGDPEFRKLESVVQVEWLGISGGA